MGGTKNRNRCRSRRESDWAVRYQTPTALPDPATTAGPVPLIAPHRGLVTAGGHADDDPRVRTDFAVSPEGGVDDTVEEQQPRSLHLFGTKDLPRIVTYRARIWTGK